MLEADLTEHQGYDRYEVKGRNSGNSRNGKRTRKVRTSGSDTLIHVPKDHKAFTADLKNHLSGGYREEAETNLLNLAEKWGGRYAIAIWSWENNWEDLVTFFNQGNRAMGDFLHNWPPRSTLSNEGSARHECPDQLPVGARERAHGDDGGAQLRAGAGGAGGASGIGAELRQTVANKAYLRRRVPTDELDLLLEQLTAVGLAPASLAAPASFSRDGNDDYLVAHGLVSGVQRDTVAA